MSKGIEYIKDISCLISENYSDKEPLTEEQKLSKNCFLDYCKYIEKELDRLEQIDNAKPSEALECLEKTQDTIQKYCNEKGLLFTDAYNIGHWLLTIKQALLKAQELEKVLDIIKKKRVNVKQLLLCWKVEMYNSRCRKGYELSKEEFDLLKRWVEKWN